MASGIVASNAMSIISINSRSGRAASSVKTFKTVKTQSGQRLRLTRRGRFLLLGVPLILLAVLGLVLMGFVTSPLKASVGGTGADATQVTVQAGESIWSIASQSGVGRDPRDVVAEIVQLNNLKSSVLQPGQQIFVPQH